MSDFTPKSDLPLGKRFSEVYRERGKSSADSERMRRRIASKLVDYGHKFEKHAESELGIATPWVKVGQLDDIDRELESRRRSKRCHRAD